MDELAMWLFKKYNQAMLEYIRGVMTTTDAVRPIIPPFVLTKIAYTEMIHEK